MPRVPAVGTAGANIAGNWGHGDGRRDLHLAQMNEYLRTVDYPHETANGFHAMLDAEELAMARCG